MEINIFGYKIIIEKIEKSYIDAIPNQCILQNKQDIEDANYIRYAKEEAYEMFEQWLQGQYTPTAKLLKEKFGITEIPVLLVPKPRYDIYKIYTKPNYDLDYNEIKRTEFTKLKKEYFERDYKRI